MADKTFRKLYTSSEEGERSEADDVDEPFPGSTELEKELNETDEEDDVDPAGVYIIQIIDIFAPPPVFPK